MLREYMLPFKNLLKITLSLGLLAFPVLGIVQWISPEAYKPYDKYIDLLSFLWKQALHWGDWLVIAAISIGLMASTKGYYDTAEKIRANRIALELDRWANTPYIPPLLFYYLVTPQPAYSPYLKDVATNRFNQDCVNMFRSRVFIDAAYSDPEPKPKSQWYQVMGMNRLLPIALGLLALIGFFYVLSTAKPSSEWFTGMERFAIPFLMLLSMWLGQQAYAVIVVGSGKKVDAALFEYFNELEPKITWREVYPDRPMGDVIIKAWGAAREQMQRNYYYFSNRPIPADNRLTFDNPALAPFPFPGNQIPEWANDMEQGYLAKTNEWQYQHKQKVREISKKSKGKVVSIDQKRAR